MTLNKPRDPALDLIRCTALLCVICVHFFANTGFYSLPVSGIDMLVMIIMRSSFMICVPLFLLLTGYLNQSRELNRNYLRKLLRILYVYLAVSFLCGLYRIFWLREPSVPSVILRIFSYETAAYSWYIEMYLGLFLLIPFLNTMYEGLKTQRNKQILIGVMLSLTALPSILNSVNFYRFDELQWWLMPSTEAVCIPLIPDYWTDIYPVTYFFLGKYLREYPVKFTPKQLAAWGGPVFLLVGLYNFYRSRGNPFVWGPWQENSSLFLTLQAVLVFCFLLRLDYTALPSMVRRALAAVSDLSLGAYLISWLFDSILYARLNGAVEAMPQKLLWFPVITGLVLGGSLLGSYGIDLSYSLITKKRAHSKKAKEWI